MVDALGSVVGTSNKDNSVSRRYQYKPYGTRLTASGTGSDPRFQWVGAPGYRTTDRSHSSHYVRARHYAQDEGRWTTVDPLRRRSPSLKRYQYCRQNPIHRLDPSGLVDQITPVRNCGNYAPCPPSIVDTANSCCKRLPTPDDLGFAYCVHNCVEESWPGMGDWADAVIEGLSDYCRLPGSIVLNCPPNKGKPDIWPTDCLNPCSPSVLDNLTWSRPIFKCRSGKLWEDIGGDTEISTGSGEPCKPLACGGPCAISLCMDTPGWPGGYSTCETLFHEATHCLGLLHKKLNGSNGTDLVFVIGQCISSCLPVSLV